MKALKYPKYALYGNRTEKPHEAQKTHFIFNN